MSITTIAPKTTLKLKPAERQHWLLNYMREMQSRAPCKLYFNILDAAFSDTYITVTGASCKPTTIGAFQCKALGSDLGALYRRNRLTRSTCVLPAGSANEGFPNWIYQYSL
jgi:hypothetical protein